MTQLWLWWHGHHSKIRFSTRQFRKHYGTEYECIVCGAVRKDRKRKKRERFEKKHPTT